MTKAEEKRRKQLRERLLHRVSFLLKGFENKYLGAYTEWNMNRIKALAEQYPTCNTVSDLVEMYPNATLNDLSIFPNYRMGEQAHTVAKYSHYSQVWNPIKNARKTLVLENIVKYDFMHEAAQGYKEKLSRLIDKLVAFNFDTRHLKIEQAGTEKGEMAILIHNEEVTCHARAIWVNGVEVAPHYRFITTIRKK